MSTAKRILLRSANCPLYDQCPSLASTVPWQHQKWMVMLSIGIFLVLDDASVWVFRVWDQQYNLSKVLCYQIYGTLPLGENLWNVQGLSTRFHRCCDILNHCVFISYSFLNGDLGNLLETKEQEIRTGNSYLLCQATSKNNSSIMIYIITVQVLPRPPSKSSFIIIS